eukprot:1391648-Amorphochlora_amoeboformis.AAC.1
MPRHRRSAKTLTSLPKTLASKASESRALASSSKSKVKLSRARVPMVTNRTLRKTPRRFRTPSRRLTRTVSGNTKRYISKAGSEGRARGAGIAWSRRGMRARGGSRGISPRWRQRQKLAKRYEYPNGCARSRVFLVR